MRITGTAFMFNFVLFMLSIGVLQKHQLIVIAVITAVSGGAFAWSILEDCRLEEMKKNLHDSKWKKVK